MSGAVALGLTTGSAPRDAEEQNETLEAAEKQDSELSAGDTASGRLEPTSARSEEDSRVELSSSANQAAVLQNAAIVPAVNTAIAPGHLASRNPSLHINTHMAPLPPADSAAASARLQTTPSIFETPVSEDAGLHPSSTSPAALPPVTSSAFKPSLSVSSMASLVSQGSASALTSPYLAAMADITPLPSPLTSTDPSKRQSWRISLGRPATPRSREGSMDEAGPSGKQISPSAAMKKRKGYGSLLQDAVEASMVNSAVVEDDGAVDGSKHGRNRSISDFVPEHLHNLRQRHVTFGPGDAANFEAQDHRMQREEYLATKRGLNVPSDAKFPTPPASTSSVAESDETENEQPQVDEASPAEYLEIHCGVHSKRRKFRQLRQLGQGAFSKVVLATREKLPANTSLESEENLDPHKLVAVKIVEQGPAGGADEQRIENGLKREVEMLKSLSHPSLIHLKAWEYQESRALLVLTYCPGGDLFEFASLRRDLLIPNLVQRMFAELVGAVRYLHNNWIVHRDIKLENVLVNLSPLALNSLTDPRTHPRPIVTLTDLGLSRRIPHPPESPLLTTRCGSEDYAAPEILLGERYEGRSTDAWALGVLLYALMEGRLPFDAPPGKPERSRNTHRIARCDWIWCRFGDDDGDWDSARAGEFDGARLCVEGLLKKVRMGRKPLEAVESMEWVREGIQIPNGLTLRAEDENDEIY